MLIRSALVEEMNMCHILSLMEMRNHDRNHVSILAEFRYHFGKLTKDIMEVLFIILLGRFCLEIEKETADIRTFRKMAGPSSHTTVEVSLCTSSFRESVKMKVFSRTPVKDRKRIGWKSVMLCCETPFRDEHIGFKSGDPVPNPVV